MRNLFYAAVVAGMAPLGWWVGVWCYGQGFGFITAWVMAMTLMGVFAGAVLRPAAIPAAAVFGGAIAASLVHRGEAHPATTAAELRTIVGVLYVVGITWPIAVAIVARKLIRSRRNCMASPQGPVLKFEQPIKGQVE